jgi:UDP-glucuronate decarboxylase
MRYLVAGGAGFLGTNLCLRLLDAGHEVVAVDDLSTSYSGNVSALSGKPGFKLVQHDIVSPLPDLGRFDFIYNLACPASPSKYQKNPMQTFRTSVWGVWNVLQFASVSKTPVFQASTSEIYGDPLAHPQAEGYFGNVNPIGPRSCYDEGKRAAESLIMDFHRKTGHPVKIARIFNTYGPHMDPGDGRVVSEFVIKALRDMPVTIYGNGLQTRSFCYVDDMIEGFIRLERSRADFTGPVNLGSESECTLLGLLGTLESALGKKVERNFALALEDDPRQRKPDMALAKKELDWAAKISLEDGLKRTAEYFRKISASAPAIS